jgi:ketosteroid isomerase-like protein
MQAAATHDLEVAKLHELNHHYVRAVAESDVAWFEQHLAQDFLNTNPDCSLVDRTGFLAQIAKPVAIRNLREDDVRIRVFGDCAIVHATTSYVKPDGSTGAGRYTDVWTRDAGDWRCVAAHVNRR